MIKIFSTIACLLMLYAVHAQISRPKRNSLGISAGWQQMKFFDQHASPLIYKATASPRLGVFYNHQSDRSIFNIKVSGGVGTANPERFGARDYQIKWSDTSGFRYQVASQFINANIQTTYLRRLSPLNSKFSTWVGGTINESAYYADEVANFNWFTNAVDFSPALQLNYAVNNKHNLGVKIDFASIGVLTRMVYSFFPKSNKDKNVVALFKQGTRVASVNKYQKVNVVFDYKYFASNSIALGADYQVKWFRYTYPKTIKAIDNSFNLNMEYLFH